MASKTVRWVDEPLDDEAPLASPVGKASSGSDEDEPEENGSSVAGFICRATVIQVVVLAFPLICRFTPLPPPARAALVILAVLLFNLAEVMPIYCTSLFIPVMGTLCQVLGNHHHSVATSTLLVGKFFNQVSFMVLGALVINGIFVKCKLEKRMMDFLLTGLDPSGPFFLLLLLMGGMAACSVLFSGSLLMISGLEPLMKKSNPDHLGVGVSKRLMLAVAYASNAGSTWFPISSPVNLITIALLAEFDYKISLSSWVAVAVPCATLTMLGTWVFLIICHPRDALSATPSLRRAPSMYEPKEDKEGEALTAQHYLFLCLGTCAVFVITVYATELEPIFGHAAIISLALVVVVFGSGFMSDQEFRELDWDLLAVVGGTNVMAFIVRETGLAAVVSNWLVANEFFMTLNFWTMLAFLVFGTVMLSTAAGHTLTGVLILPLVVAVGVKLQGAQTVAILVAIAVPMGMGMPHSSFDNQLVTKCSKSKRLDREELVLGQKDFRKSGFLLTILAACLLLTVGYSTCINKYGLPPPVVIAETGTPDRLKPKVATENLPSEVEQIKWNRQMQDWEDFKTKPDHKAFAVGKKEVGHSTRGWSATWNHPSQGVANSRAIKDCEMIAHECEIIYPPGPAGLVRNQAGNSRDYAPNRGRYGFLAVDANLPRF